MSAGDRTQAYTRGRQLSKSRWRWGNAGGVDGHALIRKLYMHEMMLRTHVTNIPRRCLVRQKRNAGPRAYSNELTTCQRANRGACAVRGSVEIPFAESATDEPLAGVLRACVCMLGAGGYPDSPSQNSRFHEHRMQLARNVTTTPRPKSLIYIRCRRVPHSLFGRCRSHSRCAKYSWRRHSWHG